MLGGGPGPRTLDQPPRKLPRPDEGVVRHTGCASWYGNGEEIVEEFALVVAATKHEHLVDIAALELSRTTQRGVASPRRDCGLDLHR